jgi:exo-1,4-beta-D-glucosaminidase
MAACGGDRDPSPDPVADVFDAGGDPGGTDGDLPPEGPAPLPLALDLTAWRVASSAAVGTDGAALSTAGYDDSAWTPARVPGTVAGAQLEAGLLGDPFFGTGLQQVPGWMWSFLPMPEDSPYAASWWWRVEFDAPDAPAGARTVLAFEGINYAANVFLNGHPVATRDDVVGTFREHRLDATGLVSPGQKCALAVEVFAPDVFSDLAIYFVDWSPEPPDYSMGLWMPARVETVGPVALRDPAIATRLPGDGSAELTLLATLANLGGGPVAARLSGRLDGRDFQADVALGAGETRDVALTSTDLPALRLESPRLWWPHDYGEPHLYRLDLAVAVDGAVSDAASLDVGVREVTAELLPPNQLRYSINGRPILIRGAGYAPDMFHRHDPGRDAAELAYAKHVGLNAIRLEGKLRDHAFYDRCDREGILLMPGWCCCDAWEDWGNWKAGNIEIAKASLASQLRRLRRHASVFTWLNGSDQHPPPDVEKAYLEVAKAAAWDLPIVSNATETPSDVTGPSGMKMTGPYDWVPPSYWYLAVPADPMSLAGRVDWEWMYGGAFGFNSESGPGYSVPPLDSLLRMMPAPDAWPPAETFLFHSGGIGSAAGRLKVFREAMDARLGPPSGLADFVMKAQVMQYEAHRAMFEAQGRNKYLATGHVQWMLNQAWPGLIWQLWDWYLRPGGTYFGAREALRPVHVQYSYDDHSVWVVNSTLAARSDLSVTARLWRLDGSIAAERTAVVAGLPADGNVPALALAPDIAAEAASLAPVYFAELLLADADGAPLDRNVYWLAVGGDTFALEPNEDNRPEVDFADMTALATLPPVALGVPAFTTSVDGDVAVVSQTLANPNDAVAFFIEVLLADAADGMPILPVLWDDNYVTLMPHGTLTLTARVSTAAVSDRKPVVRVSGWNVVPEVPTRMLIHGEPP